MSVRILIGDCRDVLRTLPAESVHCVVTSPPYWGLRDYGVDGQLGLEEGFEDWLEEMVGVFDQVRRVLRSDGVAWVNLGDCYANDGKWGGATGGKHTKYLHGGETRIGREKRRTGLKPKDLVGMPWRFAFAARDAGWWLRRDVVWFKQNPMPENVDDRPTTTHEYLFQLTKSQDYFYDAEAIKEEVSPNTLARLSQDVANQVGSARANAGGKTNGNMKAVGRSAKTQETGEGGIKNNASFAAASCLPVTHRNKRSVWSTATEAFDGEFCTRCRNYFQGDSLRALRTEVVDEGSGKLRRRYCSCGSCDDWLSHFATFPPALIEPCILAGCPRGGMVLDPFGGAGTTGLVADRLQRDAILIELNPEYAVMAARRISDEGGMLTDVRVETMDARASHTA